MRNKKLKKAILSTVSIFAFTGIILSANLDNISKLQSSFSSEYSLQNDGFKNENESSEIINSEIESISSITPLALPTVISLKPEVEIESIIAGNFPFQVNRKVMESLVSITNLPPDSTIGANVTFTATGINNVAPPGGSLPPTMAGLATINVSINNYYGSNGSLVAEGLPGYQPLLGTFTIRNFKSVARQTNYAQINSFITTNWYASDVVDGKDVTTENVFMINNGVTGIPGSNTTVNIVSKDFDNKVGSLKVSYTIQNYFDQSGQLIRTKSLVRDITVSNFKKVPGATTLILKDDGTTNTLIPSNIAKQLEINFEEYITWFELINVPEGSSGAPSGKITSIKNIVPDDKNGSIKLTYTIQGEFFNAKLVKENSLEGNEFTVTISGMNSQVEKVDIIPFVIGGSVGGVVLIAAIVTTIMLVSKSKKKKSENLRKQKLSEKVAPPTGGVAKSTTPVPSSISGSSVVPGGPKPPVGPSAGGPMNRPVPPPIRK